MALISNSWILYSLSVNGEKKWKDEPREKTSKNSMYFPDMLPLQQPLYITNQG